jgi:hypothetical protein
MLNTCEISGSYGGEYEVVFWDVLPCSHVEVDRHFRGVYCLHHQGDSPTLINFNLTTWSTEFLQKMV